jgi:hemin uptake protein HemP
MRSPYPSPLPGPRPLDEPSTAPPPRVAPAHVTAARATPPRRLTSAQLLEGATEVEIEHRGAMYRLRLTSLDKLILTK